MICVSISEKNFKQVFYSVSKYDLAEIRLDLCDFNSEQIAKLFAANQNLIATYRPSKDVTEADRLETLIKAIELGARYVDVEIESDESFKNAILKAVKYKKCDVIISYHNYDITPTARELQDIMTSCFLQGASVAKIACMANSYADSARMLSLLDSNKRLVIIAMGNYGKITRVAATFLGAEFTFAAVDEQSATAPGQMSFEKTRKIIKEIEGN